MRNFNIGFSKLSKMSFIKGLAVVLLLSAPVMSSCSKDYDDQIKNLEGKIEEGQKEWLDGLKDQKDLINQQLKTLEEALKGQIDQAKADAIAQLQRELDALEKSLNKSIESLEKQLKSEMDGLRDKIDGVEKLVDAKLIVFGTRIDKIDEKLNDLTTRVENLETRATALEKYDEYLKGLIDDLVKEDEELQKQIDQLVKDLEKAEGDLKKELQDQLERIEKNEAAIKKIIEDMETLKTDLEKDIADLDKKIDDAAKEAQDKLDAAVELLEKAIAGNTTAIEDLEGVVDANYTELLDEISRLETLIGTNMGKVQQAYTELNGKISQNTTDIAAITSRVTDLEGTVGDISDKVDKLIEDLTAAETQLGNLWFTVNQMVSGITALEGRLDQMVADLEDYYTQAEIDAMIGTALTQINGLYNQLKTQIEAALSATDVQAMIDVLKDDHHARISDCESTLTGLQTQIDDLRNDVNNLLKRVQSIVYVPDYSDGKITLNGVYSPVANTVIELDEILVTYAVLPADATREVADYFVSNPSSFSIITNQVRSRAIVTGIVDFDIVEVVPDEHNGTVTLRLAADILDEAQFLDTQQYAYQIALKLATANGDEKMTEFTEIYMGSMVQLALNDAGFYASGTQLITQADPDPNGTAWKNQAAKMWSISLGSGGVLSPYSGLANLTVSEGGQSLFDALGIDDTKIEIEMLIDGQYIYQGSSNNLIGTTLAITDGVISSTNPVLTYTQQKCIIELKVYYDGILISDGNFACLRFI